MERFIVFLLIFGAMAYLLRRAWRFFHAETSCGGCPNGSCGGTNCEGCPHKSESGRNRTKNNDL